MRRVAKITISLSIELLDAVERRQEREGESRSEAIAHLLEAAMRQEREQAEVERYIRGYLEQPETEEELLLADVLVREAATQDPWP